MHKVKLRNLKHFHCDPETSIVEAAKHNKIMLEHSCLNGRCGVCKTKLCSGQTHVLQKEIALSPEELENGFILTCCRSATADLKLEAEDLGLVAREVLTLPTRIDSIEKISPDVVKVILRLPPSSEMLFAPGQHISVIGPNAVRRSYSIANAPREDKKLELQIRQVENGLLSDYWFNNASKNDLLRIEGPLGTFCLRATEDTSTLIFLATGTGIAPIKAMLEQIAKSETPSSQNILVYWGGRSPEDFYWRCNLEIPGLNVTHVLSRQHDSWTGTQGYVQNALLEDIENLEGCTVYACGSEAMINDARVACENAGLPNHKFYSDAFVSS